MNNFSEKIKALRKQLGLTQNEFASLVSVSWPTVWRWETGKSVPPNFIARSIIEKLEREVK